MDIKEKVILEFGEKALRKSAISLENGTNVFRQVLDGKGYKTIVEIGTYRGLSAAEMSKYCDKVITIDLKNGQLERTDIDFNRRKLWKSLGVSDKIELHLIENDEQKEKLLNSIEFDFAFVDGDHGQGVNTDWKLVNKCGNVLFHDYDTSQRPGLTYVYNLVNSLPKDEVTIIDIFALWTKK